MSKFMFVYYLCDGLSPIAEVEGECSVDDHGNLEIELFEVGTAERPKVKAARFRDEIAAFLMVDHADDIDRCRREAASGRRYAERAVARNGA